MDITDFILSLTVVLSSAALALEIRRWFESGVRLNVSMMADAEFASSDDGKPKLLLTVTNRGTVPTTLTHMVGYIYKSPLDRLRKSADLSFLVPNPNVQGGLGGIPFEIRPNQSWSGLLYYDDRLIEARERGHLYVGVLSSHSDRRFLKKVPRRPPPVPKPLEEAEE